MDMIRLYRLVGLYGEYTIKAIGRSLNLSSGDWSYWLIGSDDSKHKVSPPGTGILGEIDAAFERLAGVNAYVSSRLWPALLPNNCEALEEAAGKLPHTIDKRSATNLEVDNIGECYSRDINGWALNDKGLKHKDMANSAVKNLLGGLSEPAEKYLTSMGVPVVSNQVQNPVQALLEGRGLHGRDIRYGIQAIPFSRKSEQAAIQLANGSIIDPDQGESLMFSIPSKGLLKAISDNDMVAFTNGMIHQLMQHPRRPRPDLNIPLEWLTYQTVEKMCHSAIGLGSPRTCERLLKWKVIQSGEQFRPLRELLLNRLEGDYRAKKNAS